MTKAQITKTLEQMKKTPHCESCGKLNPQMIEGEGYTICCNELCCSGFGKPVGDHYYNLERFGTEKDFKRVCCWAVAEGMFLLEGREIPENSSKL